MRKAAVMAVLAALATGCGTGGGDTDSDSGESDVPTRPDKISMVGTDPRIIVARLSSYTAMYIPGTLVYDPASKCLFLKHREQDRRSAPLWPDGTKPITYRGERGVEIPGVGRILEGDLVVANGDYAENADAITAAAIPADCTVKGQGFTTVDPGNGAGPSPGATPS